VVVRGNGRPWIPAWSKRSSSFSAQILFRVRVVRDCTGAMPPRAAAATCNFLFGARCALANLAEAKTNRLLMPSLCRQLSTPTSLSISVGVIGGPAMKGRKACQVVNAYRQNGWINNLRPISNESLVLPINSSVGLEANDTLQRAWASVKHRFNKQARARRSAQRKGIMPSSRTVAQSGRGLPAQHHYSISRPKITGTQ